MAKAYEREIANLSSTFEWANLFDIDPISRAIISGSGRPLVAIGSGGSLTAAVGLTRLHTAARQQLGVVSTPLEISKANVPQECSYWLLSAGGRNVDIIRAAKNLIAREPAQLTVMCGRADSPLVELCQRHPFVEVILCETPAGKDGFLATNSLVAFLSLLIRGYLHGNADHWKSIRNSVRQALRPHSDTVASWRELTEPLWSRPTTLVLHGNSTATGAVDVESKFVEAALSNVQLADFRNFAHGRHHWLAKRSSESAVLSLIGEDDRSLANRTINLLPASVPRASLHFSADLYEAQLLSLLAAIHMTSWIGQQRGIDPGRPGVPAFGRKLYNLSLPRIKATSLPAHLSPLSKAAITRKAGRTTELMTRSELNGWHDALNAYRDRIRSTQFDAIVLDFDGTLIDTRRRFDPLEDEVAAALNRLLSAGVTLGIATGRGKSVRTALRSAIKAKYWSKIVVGYYNGADISRLTDDYCPDPTDQSVEDLKEFSQLLTRNIELSAVAIQTNRKSQITLEPKQHLPEGRLWDVAHQLLVRSGFEQLSIVRSSHSIDILAPGVSKVSVVNFVRQEFGSDGPILTIGDRGRWPGNDYELLATPHSLSVDEVSTDLESGWNLASPGQRGVEATLEYLRALKKLRTGVAFDRDGFN